ncbi:MAG: hypothetical protein GXO86_07260, partial [Chlorobi bacterium]|nr:hypothetical protein [Chlorobiota bacterium]
MKVTRDNYEIWIIDYLDGRLTAGQVDELLAFFEENPDLKEEFESFEPVTLQPEELRFEQKSHLKKPQIIPAGEINENNYEKFFIGWYENDLTSGQKKETLAFIEKNPQLKKEFELHGQLIIKINNDVVYSGKDQLKRGRKIAIYWWASAAAAVILFFLAVNGLLKRETLIQKQNIELVNKLESKNISAPLVWNHFPGLQIKPPIIHIQINEILESPVPQERQPAMAWLPDRSFNVTGLHPVVSPPFYEPDYALSNQLLTLTDGKPKKSKGSGLIAKIFRNFTKKLKDRLPEKTKENKDKKEPPMLKALDNSILVFNTVTGSNTEI